MLYMQQPQQSTVYSKDEDLPPTYSSSVIEARCLKIWFISDSYMDDMVRTYHSRTDKNFDDLSQHLSPPPSYRRARELSECSGDAFYPQNLKDIEYTFYLMRSRKLCKCPLMYSSDISSLQLQILLSWCCPSLIYCIWNHILNEFITKTNKILARFVFKVTSKLIGRVLYEL